MIGGKVGKRGKRFTRLRAILRFAMVVALAGIAVAVPTAAFPTLAVDPAPPVLNPPLVGFSFSPLAVVDGLPSDDALSRLLEALQPDIVRLPVYWESVAPSATTLDYGEVDQLIEAVQDHNATKGARHTQIVLVVGARNLLFPEVHVPAWLDTGKVHKLDTLVKLPSYRRYLDTTFRRYAHLPELRAWQVENEPLDQATIDQVTSGALSESTLRSEIDLLRAVDLVHEVVVTTFNSSHVTLDVEGAGPLGWLYAHLPGAKPVGHPAQALRIGDTLGLDLYVVTDSTPLQTISASTRIAWKEQSLDFWQTQVEHSGRALWVTEMQGSPWGATTGFTQTDLLSSALAYRGHGVSAYLLWGVENWLDSPDWMKTGQTAFKLLRDS